MRHTLATIAIRARIPIKVITKRLGHQNPAFMMTQYAHVILGMQSDAARIVPATVREEATPPGDSTATTHDNLRSANALQSGRNLP
jgi:hypothetical protein